MNTVFACAVVLLHALLRNRSFSMEVEKTPTSFKLVVVAKLK